MSACRNLGPKLYIECSGNIYFSKHDPKNFTNRNKCSTNVSKTVLAPKSLETYVSLSSIEVDRIYLPVSGEK